jgi:hypothetical protein
MSELNTNTQSCQDAVMRSAFLSFSRSQQNDYNLKNKYYVRFF